MVTNPNDTLESRQRAWRGLLEDALRKTSLDPTGLTDVGCLDILVSCIHTLKDIIRDQNISHIQERNRLLLNLRVIRTQQRHDFDRARVANAALNEIGITIHTSPTLDADAWAKIQTIITTYVNEQGDSDPPTLDTRVLCDECGKFHTPLRTPMQPSKEAP